MNREHFILLSLWVLYCCLHSLFAAGIIKKYLCRVLKINDGSYRVVYNIVAIAGLTSLIMFHFFIKSSLVNLPFSLRMTSGICLAFAGGLLMFLCIKKYFRQLSGVRGSKTEKAQNEFLEITGLNAYVRHPLYAATFIFLAGVFLIFPLLSNLLAILVVIIYTLLGIHFEEKKLMIKFGDQYISYKKKVPMIIPFIY